MASDWIEKATSKNRGAFRAKAQKAGMSTSAYASKVKNSPSASTKTKRQAALASTLGKMNRGGKRSSRKSGRR